VSTIFAMIALLLPGTGEVAVRGEPAAPARPIAIVAYRNSGQWDADITRVVAGARGQVARHAGERRAALVLDIDDTSLSSYRCREVAGFARRVDCARGGVMPPIEQTRDLYRFAQARGLTVFFVTGRRERLRTVTLANLRHAGYTGPLRLLMRPDHQRPGRYDGWKARTRAAIERRGLKIVANVGDQRSDLDGGHALRAFKLPNPMYVIPSA
jgi:predicted secreted acid phosphatase